MATPKKAKEDYLKMGRPTKYSKELADEICKEIATGTIGISTLCRNNEHYPSYASVNTWFLKYPDFLANYLIAKERQTDLQIDEIDDLTSSSEHDFYEDNDGKLCINTAYLTRLKLKIQARMWHAGKLKPKKYGDKATNDTNEKLNELKEQVDSIKEIAQKCMKPL